MTLHVAALRSARDRATLAASAQGNGSREHPVASNPGKLDSPEAGQHLNRLILALRAFWFTLTDPEFAARVEPLFSRAPTGPDLRVLAVLQRDGRLVDFLEEEIDGYTDTQVGAAVRDIHRGCRKSLHDYLTIEPVINGVEEERVTVPTDFDPAAVRCGRQRQRLTPFKGCSSITAGECARSTCPSCRSRAMTRRCSRPQRSRSRETGRGLPGWHSGVAGTIAREHRRTKFIPRSSNRQSLDSSNRQGHRSTAMSRYVVGIDLGTTNSALAYADGNEIKEDQPGPISSLLIPQVVAVNDVAERPLLPSFYYLPGAKEFPAGAFDLPWKSPPDRVVGVFAREHGARVPGRLVSSAKSWLSPAGVDRRAADPAPGRPPTM